MKGLSMKSILIVLGATAWAAPFAGAAPAGQGDSGSTRTIRVAAVQLRGEPGGIAPNLAKAERMIREAAAQGARYILLPELYGLFPVAIAPKTIDEVYKESQPVPGLLTDRMTSLSRELDIAIGFGMAERVGERMRNTAVFVDPSGIVGVYSKRAMVTHEGLRKLAEKHSGKPVAPPKEPLGPDEGTLFEKGEGNGVFWWGGVKTGVLICADGGFDGFWQYLADQGVQLLCWPVANSGGPLLQPPFPRDVSRKYHLPMIFANHLPDQMLHEGNSEIVNAQGEAVAKAEKRQPDVVVVGDVEIAPTAARPQ